MFETNNQWYNMIEPWLNHPLSLKQNTRLHPRSSHSSTSAHPACLQVSQLHDGSSPSRSQSSSPSGSGVKDSEILIIQIEFKDWERHKITIRFLPTPNILMKKSHYRSVPLKSRPHSQPSGRMAPGNGSQLRLDPGAGCSILCLRSQLLCHSQS